MRAIEQARWYAEDSADLALPLPSDLDRSTAQSMVALRATAERTDEFAHRARVLLPPVVLELDADELDCAADIAEVEGIPLAWVPRIETIRLLVALSDADARYAHLERSYDAILADCKRTASRSSMVWMGHCSEAAHALEAGYRASAQSLASHVIDGVIKSVARQGQAIPAVNRLSAENPSMLALAELLTIKPLVNATKPFRPPQPRLYWLPPVHAMRNPNISSSLRALVTLMLATSLARQFGHASRWRGQRFDPSLRSRRTSCSIGTSVPTKTSHVVARRTNLDQP